MSGVPGNRVVQKFKVDLRKARSCEIEMSKDAELLTARQEGSDLVVYALVDPSPSAKIETLCLRVLMTGQVVPADELEKTAFFASVPLTVGTVGTVHIFVETAK
jgi:hypothetical protein